MFALLTWLAVVLGEEEEEEEEEEEQEQGVEELSRW
jgi:hypothetical protein